MKYFKVVEDIKNEVFIDTNTTNYSLTLQNKAKHSGFLNFIIDLSKKLNLPLDIFFSINNHLATLGNQYLQNLPRSKNGIFEISDLTYNLHHRTLFIKESDLIGFVENLDILGIALFEEGFYLWENIYERVRFFSHPNRPDREKSFFLFDNEKDCEYYIENHKGGGIICVVEILNTTCLFKADMKILDIIPNIATTIEAEEYANNYWLGNTSKKPVFEYLFQGKCKLNLL